MKKRETTSEFLRKAIRSKKTDRVSINELKISLHERGFAILLMFFALPMSVPAPYVPGLTTLFSVPIFILSGQMMFGVDSPYIPKYLAKKTIKRSFFRFLILKSSPLLRKIERFLKPRLFFFSSAKGNQLIGFFSLIFSISIALPLPFTNFIPALAIVIMSLGLLSHDGFTVFIGILIGFVGLAFTAGIIMFGKQIIIQIKNLFI